MKFIKIFTFFIIFALFLGTPTQTADEKVQFFEFEPIYIKASDKKTKKFTGKTKFYNFDDLLINGQYKKPQVLYTDVKQKQKFERLLKLKKDLLPKLKNTVKDPSLR